MKLSNIFTSSRLVLAPIIYVLYFLPDWIPFISPKITILIIIPIFIFMEFTDFLDGYYARLHNQVDDFGKIFDPFADVVANVTVLFCFDGRLFVCSLLFDYSLPRVRYYVFEDEGPRRRYNYRGQDGRKNKDRSLHYSGKRFDVFKT